MSSQGIPDLSRSFELSEDPETLARMLFLEAPEAMFLTDLAGRILAVNPRASEVTGHPAERLLRMGFSDLLVPDAPTLAAWPTALPAPGGAVQEAAIITRADGSPYPVELHLRRLSETRVLGKLIGRAGPDRVEDSLRPSTQALENSINGLAFASLDGIITYVNRAFLEMWGYACAGEVLGKHSTTLWNSPEEAGAAIVSLVRDGFWLGDLTARKKSGEVFPARVSASLLKDPVGNPQGLMATFFDVTDYRNAENGYRESLEKLRFLSENLADGMVYQIDSGQDGKQRKFSYLSSAVERLHGLRIEEAMQNPGLIYGQVTPEFRSLLAERETRAFENRTPLDIDLKMQLPSGDIRWRRFISAPRTQEDGTVVWDGIEMDITDRKRAEEDRERLQIQLGNARRMEAIGRLAGGVAHDFNNLLGVILASAELALRNIKPDDPVHRSVEYIQSAARRSVGLTSQLLAFARKQSVSTRVLELGEAVTGALEVLQGLVGDQIELDWTPSEEPCPVRFDPSQLDQVLANLCLNAKDAIQGRGRITLRTERVALDEDFLAAHPEVAPGIFVMLMVADDGPGMGPEVLEHLFEPFYTTKERGKGTGLGLATVYGIVTQHEGIIRVSSEPGAGTTFRIYLPPAAGSADAPEAGRSEAVPRGRGEIVLLVEDEPHMLEVARDMLRSLGYEVVTALTPSEALRLVPHLPRQKFLLVTDVLMPEMNGPQLEDQIRMQVPDLKCLFISGYPNDILTGRGVLKKGSRFLPKPFSMEDLAHQVREALER